MAIVVKRLHAVMDALEITGTEQLKTGCFPARVGKTADMMLLGARRRLSVRAHQIERHHPPGAPPNVIGSLDREEAPFMENSGAMVAGDAPGRHVILKGRATEARSGAPPAGAALDFRRSGEVGFHEGQDPDMPDRHFRRRIRTDAARPADPVEAVRRARPADGHGGKAGRRRPGMRQNAPARAPGEAGEERRIFSGSDGITPGGMVAICARSSAAQSAG